MKKFLMLIIALFFAVACSSSSGSDSGSGSPVFPAFDAKSTYTGVSLTFDGITDGYITTYKGLLVQKGFRRVVDNQYVKTDGTSDYDWEYSKDSNNDYEVYWHHSDNATGSMNPEAVLAYFPDFEGAYYHMTVEREYLVPEAKINEYDAALEAAGFKYDSVNEWYLKVVDGVNYYCEAYRTGSNEYVIVWTIY